MEMARLKTFQVVNFTSSTLQYSSRMVESRARPLSVDGGASSSRKRQKTEHIEAHFATNLLEQTSVNRLHDAYAKSGPYKHVVVEKLFQDDLVEKVKNECIGELSFTEKETDIYKVRS